jgi:hypothetical protein
MKLSFFMTAACLMALPLGPVLAQAPQPLLSGTVGSGVNESYLVLDFETGTSQTPDATYAFGYLYSPSTTGTEPNGLDMIQALQSANIGFDDTVTTYSFGTIIDSFSYNGLSEGGFQSNGYWAYYTSPSSVFGQESNFGLVDRTLSNGSFDGWAWDTGSDPVPVTPFASNAVPEAGSAWLLLLALPFGFLAARRRVCA